MSAPLILAIHPDRRQAPKLASIARHASAELLLAESMERAIAMLSERLPDLILTPTLLSHRDETALADRLRELGDVAAHVQTLTIPIFETASSASGKRGGVLSSLRKPKPKGKSHAAETVGCTVDTFAEQVSIYLGRAVEARIARPAVQAQTPTPGPEPEPTHEAQTQNTEGPAEAGHYVHELQHEPQNDERHLTAHPTADGLPTIEELAARTPAVPEPERPARTRIDVITGVLPAAAAIPLPPATPVETSVKAITIIERSDSIRPPDCPVPAAVPRVAELFMEMRSLERAAASGRVVHALPAPAAMEIATEPVAALVTVVNSAAAAPSVPMPGLPPRIAELATQLLRAETDSHIHAIAPVVPALPTGSAEMNMAAVAAMVPVSTVVGERALPTPAAVSPLTELRMELPPMAATGNAALPIVPESGGSASVEALAAMAFAVGIVDANRPLPMPAATPAVADLAMTLPSTATAFATPAVAPVVPESGRSVQMSMQVVAGIVPLAAEQTHDALAPIPVTATRVVDLAMKLPSPSVDANIPVLPEFPTGPTDAPADAVAAIMPLARAAAHQGIVPAPAVVPHVIELPMQLPPMAAVGSPQADILTVTQTPAAVMRTETGAVAAVVEAIPPSADEGEVPPASPSVPLPIGRRTKKKPTLQERKAARKNGRKPDRLDDTGIFDPDECRFAALVAKLDEVVLRGEGPHAAGPGAGRQPRGRKPARSPKKH